MTPLIYIIVPVYNVEKYLSRCLNSIQNQTYKNLNVIVIDDGSTDNSGKICDEYAAQDSRFVVIHKPNGGLSSARNAGLEYIFDNEDMPSEKYIGFVDSDDYIALDMFENALNVAMKNNADIVTVGINVVDVDGKYLKSMDQNSACFSRDDVISVFSCGVTNNITYSMRAYVWNKLFCLELFRNVRFPADKTYEDIATLPTVLCSCKKVIFLPESKYFYVQRAGSITNSVPTLDWADACFQAAFTFNTNGYSKAAAVWLYAAIDRLAKTINYLGGIKELGEAKSRVKHLRDKMKLLCSQLKKGAMPAKHILYSNLFFYFPNLYCILKR